MIMQDIPYDIWQHIVSFLSSEDVKGLLSVNGVLFSIAMDERYKESLIGSLFSTHTRRSLKRLM
jgi:hypothetical protein